MSQKLVLLWEIYPRPQQMFEITDSTEHYVNIHSLHVLMIPVIKLINKLDTERHTVMKKCNVLKLLVSLILCFEAIK